MVGTGLGNGWPEVMPKTAYNCRIDGHGARIVLTVLD